MSVKGDDSAESGSGAVEGGAVEAEGVDPSAEAAEAAEPADGPEAAKSGTGAAHRVAGGILLSRIAGLVRERVFAHFFGTSAAADVFRAGLRMPNVVQNLLGEGVLSASFIPVYAELLEEDRREEAGRVAGAIFMLLIALAGGFALVGILFAPTLVTIFVPGFEGFRFDLTVTVVRILFPMMGILVLSAWALGILNAHRRFFISYVAPVLWSAAMIAALLIFGGTMDLADLAIVLAWGALIGGLLQFGIQLPWVWRVERELEIRWRTRLEGVRTAVRNAGPAILGRGVVQLSAYLDTVLASFLAVGAIAALGYAQMLYVLPISLFGMSVAAAELPELARERQGRLSSLRQRVNAGLEQIAFYVVPSVVGYLALGPVVVAALYQTGTFGSDDTLLVYLVLAGYAVGLLASAGTRLFASAFYALHDTRTPAKFAFVRVLLAGTGGLALMLELRDVSAAGHTLGVVGLSVASGLAAWVEWGLTRRVLRQRIGKTGFRGPMLVRMFGAALPAAGAALLIRMFLPPVHHVLAAVAVLVPYVLIYFALGRLFGLEEGRKLLGSLTGRFRA